MSTWQYADPVCDLLDKHKTFEHRLFREHCVHHRGNYVKDLSRLGRDVSQVCVGGRLRYGCLPGLALTPPARQTIIVDNSPASYLFHPDNAVPVVSWFDDTTDRELLDLIPFLEDVARVADISKVLQ